VSAQGELVYLALGSNLGDRQRHLQAAVAALRQVAGVSVLRLSSVVETPALLASPESAAQPAYLNQVVELACTLSPAAMLAAVRAIEAGEGRVRRERWSSRTLDLDIVLFGSRVIDTAVLTVPHPEMIRRAFVLGPLRELVPGLVHPPSGLTVDQLWNDLEV
jgi:2-amino-4-hydroxy-6-hydroxymethyldihydropteridine diphosphokinase